MADSGSAGLGQANGQSVPQDQVDAVLSAVDRAFADVVHARYGGGVHSVFLRGSKVQEQRLRAAPASNPSYLLLELHLREEDEEGGVTGPTGFSRLFQGLSTVIGDVSVSPAPDSRAAEVHVLTEVFDDQDSGHALAGATLPTGVSLEDASCGSSNPMGPRGIHVVRTEAGQQESDKRGRQEQRGWGPSPTRMRSNRGGGLGSNGHRRASASSLPIPISSALLQCIGDRLAKAGAVGAALEKVVVGLELGDVH